MPAPIDKANTKATERLTAQSVVLLPPAVGAAVKTAAATTSLANSASKLVATTLVMELPATLPVLARFHLLASAAMATAAPKLTKTNAVLVRASTHLAPFVTLIAAPLLLPNLLAALPMHARLSQTSARATS